VAEFPQPVVLDVPRGPSAVSPIRVVIGWVGSCNDAALDQLDDINLALETLIGSDEGFGGTLSLTVSVRQGTMYLLLEGLQGGSLRANLEAKDDVPLSFQWPLDLRIFLGALVDEYEIIRSDGESFGVSMRKGIC
jgi:hypothetical protein